MVLVVWPSEVRLDLRLSYVGIIGGLNYSLHSLAKVQKLMRLDITDANIVSCCKFYSGFYSKKLNMFRYKKVYLFSHLTWRYAGGWSCAKMSFKSFVPKPVNPFSQIDERILGNSWLLFRALFRFFEHFLQSQWHDKNIMQKATMNFLGYLIHTDGLYVTPLPFFIKLYLIKAVTRPLCLVESHKLDAA